MHKTFLDPNKRHRLFLFLAAVTLAYIELEFRRDEIVPTMKHYLRDQDPRFETAARLLVSGTTSLSYFLGETFSSRLNETSILLVVSFFWNYFTILSFSLLAFHLFRQWKTVVLAVLACCPFICLGYFQEMALAQTHIFGFFCLGIFLAFEFNYLLFFLFGLVASCQRPDCALASAFLPFAIAWLEQKRKSVQLLVVGVAMAAISISVPKLIMAVKEFDNYQSFPILKGDFIKLSGNINYLPQVLMWSSVPLLFALLRSKLNKKEISLLLPLGIYLGLVTFLADYSEPRLLMPWFGFLILIGTGTFVYDRLQIGPSPTKENP